VLAPNDPEGSPAAASVPLWAQATAHRLAPRFGHRFPFGEYDRSHHMQLAQPQKAKCQNTRPPGQQVHWRIRTNPGRPRGGQNCAEESPFIFVTIIRKFVESSCRTSFNNIGVLGERPREHALGKTGQKDDTKPELASELFRGEFKLL
jgi:hypothetical protein